MKQFVTEAIDIAWSLVTAVPPLIASCEEQNFCENLHEKAFTWDDKRPSNYKLKYNRPVLYTNFLGAVTQRGLVRNAKPVEGTWWCFRVEPHLVDILQ